MTNVWPDVWPDTWSEPQPRHTAQMNTPRGFEQKPRAYGACTAPLSLDTAFARSPDLVGLVSAADRHWRYINPAFSRLLGFAEDELLAAPASNIIYAEDRHLCRLAEDDLFGGNSVEIENRVTCKSGRYIWVSWSLTPIADQNLVLCIGRDVTARHRALADARHRAFEAAAEAEELGLTFDRAPIGLAVLDSDFKFKRINRRLAEINGIPVVEHLGRSVWSIVPDPDLKRIAEPALRAVRDSAETISNIEIEGTTPGTCNEVRRWREHFYPVDRPGSREIGIICEDVTEAQRAKSALAANEARLRIALEGARAGVWEWDFSTGVAYWSPEMPALLGLPPNTPASREAFEAAIHPDDRDLFLDRFQSVVEGVGTKFDLEFRLAAPAGGPGGEQLWLSAVGCIERDALGRPLRARGINQDITARKRAEIERAASAAQLRQALEAGKVFAFEWDRATDVTLRSPTAAGIIGLAAGTASLASGKAFIRHVHPDDRAAVLAITTRERTPETPSYQISYRFVRDDGRQIWIEETGAARFDRSGRALGVHGICRDITSRKEAEAQKQLLMGEIGHRAKNILAVVQAVIHFTKADTVAEFSRAVQQRVQALARVQRLLSASEWTGTGLRTLIANELEPFGGADGERLILEGPPLTIRAHVMQTLTLVVHELATNAAKYGALSCEAGSVHVTWCKTPDGNVRIVWHERGGPPVAEPKRRGFGSRLIEESLGQLGGHASLTYAREGLVCELTIAKDGFTESP